MPRYIEGVTAQAEAMKTAWAVAGGSISDLTLDAFASLSAHPEVNVLRVPEVVPGDSELGCSVAGGYRASPPTLIVTESMSKRRQHFTLLHELGHHIQRTNLDLGRAVLRRKDRVPFEDGSCDAFAASVLLPDDMVDQACVAFGGPTAQTAVDLFETSNASRAAIAVRLIGRLKASGAVAVVDDAGIVTFAAARGSVFPPAKQSDQSRNPLIRAALEDPGAAPVWTRDDAQIWYQPGHSSNQLYGQAAWVGNRLMVIMVEEAAPWRTYSPPRDFTAARSSSRWHDCDTCGRNFEVKVRCFTCDEPKCPKGHGNCSEPTEKQCDTCFLVKHTSQFDAGSNDCKECA